MTEWIDKAIQFVLQHNEVMVQTMLVLVVAWGALILGSWVLSRGEETSASVAPAVAAPAPSAEATVLAAEAAMQVAKLQVELTTRAQEVESLKAKISAAPPAETVDISGYVKKIKDLEGKLAEYEILEDDIADLSLYKEENIRLKNELQRLGGTATPASAEPTAAATPPPPSQQEPTPVAATVTPGQSDAIVGQFAVAVEQNKSAAPSPATEPVQDGDDLLTEFAASMSDSSAASANVEDSGLDTEKMMAEMASLEGVQDDGSALEGETDMDKMAAEATKLMGS